MWDWLRVLTLGDNEEGDVNEQTDTLRTQEITEVPCNITPPVAIPDDVRYDKKSENQIKKSHHENFGEDLKFESLSTEQQITIHWESTDLSAELFHDHILINFINNDSAVENIDKSYTILCKEILGSTMRRVRTDTNHCTLCHLTPDTEYNIYIIESTNGMETNTLNQTMRTLFCEPPCGLEVIHNKGDSYTLSWEPPSAKNNITGYNIQVCDFIKPAVIQQFRVESNVLSICMELDSSNSHRFHVSALSKNKIGSKASVERLLLKHDILSLCHKQDSGRGMGIKILPSTDIDCSYELIKIRDIGKSRLGKMEEAEKVILLVGETGGGKTTWINAFTNFLFNVKRMDPFRFKIIEENAENDQTGEKTHHISIYRLHHQNGMQVNSSITIIDTPGFGDVKGTDRDNQIEREIAYLFSHKNGYLEHINVIAFVMPASSSRLSPTQKYIFDSIMTLFGRDIKENMIFLFTYADFHHPLALGAVKAHSIENDTWFQFDSMTIMETEADDDEDDIDEAMWNFTMENFHGFASKLKKLEAKTISQTQDVLSTRVKLGFLLSNLKQCVEDTLIQLDQLRREEQLLSKMNRSGETYTADYVTYEKIPDPSDRFHAFCEKCERTCHEDCPITDNESLYRCIAMNKANKEATCNICPNKCPWNTHKRRRHMRVKRKIVTKPINLKTIQARYKMNQDDNLRADQIFNHVCDDLDGTACKLKVYFSEITGALETLQDISLMYWPKNLNSYIDQIIEQERQEAKHGYMSRVKLLERFKQEAEDLQSVDSAMFDPFKPYRTAAAEVIAQGNDMTQPSVWKIIANKVRTAFRSIKSGNWYAITMNKTALSTHRGRMTHIRTSKVNPHCQIMAWGILEARPLSNPIIIFIVIIKDIIMNLRWYFKTFPARI